MNNTTYYILTIIAPWGRHSVWTRCQAWAELLGWGAELVGFDTRLTVPRYGSVWPWR